MNPHLKNFGIGFLIGSLLGLILGFSVFPLTGMDFSILDFISLQQVFFEFISLQQYFLIGSILFGLMFAVYNKLGGNEAVKVFLIAAGLIAIMFWCIHLFTIFPYQHGSSTPESTLLYYIFSLLLMIGSIGGFIFYLKKFTNASIKLIIISSIWFLIVFGFYNSFSFILMVAFLGG